ncbi:MAG: YaeQ family protein, partial [Bdellovibrionota bacterium]
MPVSVFTSQVELQQNYKSVFRKKVVLGRTEYETDEHVLLKLLAWLLFFHPRIVIEKKMEGDFEPDLILEDYDGTVKLWIECGRVSVNKLDKLTRRYPDARLYVLLASERDIPMMVKNIEKKVERLSRIRLVAFKEKVVDSLLPVFSDRNE